MISAAIHRTSHNIVYDELGWERLDDHRKKQRLQVFYMTINEDTPIYLQNIVPIAMHKTTINHVIKSTTSIPGLEHHSSKIKYNINLLMTGITWTMI